MHFFAFLIPTILNNRCYVWPRVQSLDIIQSKLAHKTLICTVGSHFLFGTCQSANHLVLSPAQKMYSKGVFIQNTASLHRRLYIILNLPGNFPNDEILTSKMVFRLYQEGQSIATSLASPWLVHLLEISPKNVSMVPTVHSLLVGVLHYLTCFP